MCVILVSKTDRLTDQLIEWATDANPHGNGIAWIKGGAVHFEKGITIARAQHLARTVPMPYVFHARIATVGAQVPGLCHPFPIDRRLNPNQTTGRSKSGVLFHNGTWHGWQDYVDATDDGDWSDSRAMAELAGAYGRPVLAEVVPVTQRIAVLDKTGVHLQGNGWQVISHKGKSGIYASNRHFLAQAEPWGLR